MRFPDHLGPRNCIGQKFAMYEMKSACTKIIRNFEISPSPRLKIELFGDLTLKTANGVVLKIKRRT